MRHPTYEPFYVTRQHYYYSGEYVVEVVQGRDSIGADAYSPRYPGEFESFVSAVDAVQAAFHIQEAWHKDFPAMLGRDVNRAFHDITATANAHLHAESTPESQLEVISWAFYYLEQVADILSQDWPQVSLGNTWGASLELETGTTDEELLAVAQKIDDNAPKCAGCRDIRQEDWTLPDEVDPDQAVHYCSENCANRAIENYYREQAKFADEEADTLIEQIKTTETALATLYDNLIGLAQQGSDTAHDYLIYEANYTGNPNDGYHQAD